QDRDCAAHGVCYIYAGAVGGNSHAIWLGADAGLGYSRVGAISDVEDTHAVVIRVGDREQPVVRTQRYWLRTGRTRVSRWIHTGHPLVSCVNPTRTKPQQHRG